MDCHLARLSHRRSRQSVPPRQYQPVGIRFNDDRVEIRLDQAPVSQCDGQWHAGQHGMGLTVRAHIQQPYLGAWPELVFGVLKPRVRTVPIAFIEIRRHAAFKTDCKPPAISGIRPRVTSSRQPCPGKHAKPRRSGVRVGYGRQFIAPLERTGWQWQCSTRCIWIEPGRPGNQRHTLHRFGARQCPHQPLAPMARPENSGNHRAGGTYLQFHFKLPDRTGRRRVSMAVDDQVNQRLDWRPVGFETHSVFWILGAFEINISRPHRHRFQRRAKPSLQIEDSLNDDNRLRLPLRIERGHQLSGKRTQVFDHHVNFARLMVGIMKVCQ